jgi:hypothetical protein
MPEETLGLIYLEMLGPLADYCGWAITIAWERGERRSLDLIRLKVKSQFDIFAKGTHRFY